MTLEAHAVTVEPLAASDVVGVAQCLVIDADVFPTESVTFRTGWGQSQLWAARGADRRVVGFIALVRRDTDRYIEAIGVSRGSQRQGIGRALMEAAIAHAREVGARKLSLHVSVANRGAIELYRSCGFSPNRRVHRFYRPGLFHESDDAYEMVRLTT